MMVGRGGEPPDWTGVGVGGASRNRLCRGSRVGEARYPFAREERRSAPATGRHAAMWSGAGAILVLATLLSSGARAQSSLPDASMTPGAINPAVTQRTIGETIWPRGWTRMGRPPVKYTEELKR